jgi:hypothetical protein
LGCAAAGPLIASTANAAASNRANTLSITHAPQRSTRGRQNA